MTTYSKKRKKQLLALFLSAMMVSSFAVFTACNDEDKTSNPDKETEDTAAESDSARITNGSFEFYTVDAKKPIVTSPGSWSRSNDTGASTSKTASGIINTEASAWKNLTTSSGKSFATVDEAKANWKDLTVKDKLDFYEAQKDEDKLDFYESFNIDAEDIPTCENPGTHYAATDANAAKNTNVLMIHNDYNSYGTAQKFTSSKTITISAGTYAELSVWVKTSDLTFSDDAQEVIEGRGAYIGITHTVGGTTLDQMQVKNINTEGVTDNNGWVNYTFYLKGCSYATSTFKVVLGLGQSSVKTSREEVVSGYAFFDDVTCKILGDSDKADEGFSAVTNNANVTNVTIATPAKDKKISADTNTNTVFGLDMDKVEEPFVAMDFNSSIAPKLTEEEAKNGVTYISAKYDKNGNEYTGNKVPFGSLALKTADDVTEVTSFTNVANATGKLGAVKDDFTKPEAFAKDEILLLLSGDGAAYTADVKEFSVEADSYLAISLFVKTSDVLSYTGAGIKLVDEYDREVVLSNVNTTTVAAVDLDTDDKSKKEDIYAGWQQCFFFIHNETDTNQSFKMYFTYGTTTIVGSKASDYYAGYAALTNVETRAMNEKEYGYVSEGTYAKKFVLEGEEKVEKKGTSFDEASEVGRDITAMPANAINYKGVYGGSGFVNGTSTDSRLNEYKYAGLINQEYVDKKDEDGNAVAGYDWLPNANALIGDATQPLVIYNNNDDALSYGFIGASQSVAATSYGTVSVRVKVSANAQANVYLIDMDDKSHETVLGWKSGVTFWYDDEGNVCASDPSDKDFNKKTDVAFKLQENGLYLANDKWSGYKAEMKDVYFANLANYEKDAENNLIVKEGGVEYSYNSNWQNAGNDGIAFYYNAADQKYYAYKNGDSYTTPVSNLADIAGLARYDAVANKELKATVTNTNGKWATVTFYLHTGSVAKNYRLEVWAGNREGTEKIAKGEYVLFDASGASTLTDDTFKSLIEEAKENIEADTQKNNYAGESFDGVYSFYDDAAFLRYDATLDENEIGNSYESYVASAYTEGTAYMSYTDKANLLNATFVDFNLSEVTVAADVEEEEDDTTEEETTTEPETNIWLLASSIVIAAVLVLAVISIIVRKAVQKARKNKARAVVMNKSKK